MSPTHFWFRWGFQYPYPTVCNPSFPQVFILHHHHNQVLAWRFCPSQLNSCIPQVILSHNTLEHRPSSSWTELLSVLSGTSSVILIISCLVSTHYPATFTECILFIRPKALRIQFSPYKISVWCRVHPWTILPAHRSHCWCHSSGKCPNCILWISSPLLLFVLASFHEWELYAKPAPFFAFVIAPQLFILRCPVHLTGH